MFPFPLIFGKSGPGWDAAKTRSGLILSNGALTATVNTSGGTGLPKGTRSSFSRSSGKVYCELANQSTLGTAGGGGFCIGLGTSAWDPSGSDIAIFGSNTLTYLEDGRTFINGVAGAASVNFNTASQTPVVIGLAIDLDNKKAWLKNITTGSNWNNNASDNPATGVGGLSFAFSGPYYLGHSQENDKPFSSTLNIGGATYVGTPPSGFGNW